MSQKQESTPTPRPAARISIFQLAILTTVTVASLRSLPTMATFGMGSILMYVIPAVFFLVPTALVAAELATGWHGGVYVWVREAFGNRWGFQAVWLQWIQNVVWYPVQLAFIGAAFAYMVVDPGLATSGLYTAIIILVFYWLATLLTLRGGNLFARVGSWAGLVGTIIPGVILIILGALWLSTGNRSQVPLEAGDMIPPFAGIASIVLIVSNFLGFAGMEVNAVHAQDMKKPGKEYPRAILLATVLILIVFVLPTIAVALVVTPDDLGLTTGIVVAFQNYFAHWGLGWAAPVLAGMVAIGALSSVIAWVAGPSRGLLNAARTGLLPPLLQRRNAAGVQVNILIMQGMIVTLLAAIFVVLPNVSAAFFTLVDMAAALYLIMYMLMFAAAIKLRRSRPGVVRSYRVPALTAVASIGFIASLLAFLLGFVPPSGLAGIPTSVYPFLMGVVIVALGVPPLLFFRFRKAKWDQRTDSEKAQSEQDMLANPLPASPGAS
ncbi:MAG: amino acid permease [Candidatus Nanopelagicales bacterium]|nr:amino acid permease [Candidatus Nanopelagicales bacterium]MDZ4249654.1 amino acid permease [Candidatus Nanopelagicales bacterium]MDZ7578111.1 amino acid permease [Candidatus Nanopelagicales bacterium]